MTGNAIDLKPLITKRDLSQNTAFDSYDLPANLK